MLSCRAIRHLHGEAANQLELDRDCGEEVEKLLNELQQLLVGISIMQVNTSLSHLETRVVHVAKVCLEIFEGIAWRFGLTQSYS